MAWRPIFEMEHDMGKCVGNYKGLLHRVEMSLVYYGLKLDQSFTDPLYILHSTSLPGFADGGQQTELNQTLPNGRK